MKTIKKSLLIIFVSLIMLSVLCVSALGFTYKHDPSLNAYAMQDIVADETAIYGFKPNDTGSLKAYAAADWSDPEVVEKGRQERIAYHESIESMYDILEEMTADGKSVEEIARAVSTKRNEIRLAAYDNDPEGLETLKARNLEKYGHEEGPLPDELYAQYGSWETVLEKAFSVNAGMDACLGLYDDYYDVYVALGQVEDLPIDTTEVAENSETTELPQNDTSTETDAPEIIDNTDTTENPESTAKTELPKGVIIAVTVVSVVCLSSVITFVVYRKSLNKNRKV